MGSITRTPIRDSVVDFSHPYFFTRMAFVTKKPYALPKFLAIVWPYGTGVWMSLGITVPLFCFVYWGFSKLDKRGTSRYNFGIGQVLQILLKQGKKRKILWLTKIIICVYSTVALKKWPPTWGGRSILTSWTLFALIMTSGEQF